MKFFWLSYIIILSNVLFIPQAFCHKHDITKPSNPAHASMVVTENRYATQVGLQVLKHGGNAIDAAVAIGYALAVVSPYNGNLGGGGFMMLHLANGQNKFLDFRETAPAAANLKLFANKNLTHLRHHYLSVATPGTVLGLNTALKKYGHWSLAQVLQPAIQLAKQGFKISAFTSKRLNMALSRYSDEKAVQKIFRLHGKPYPAGAILKQPQLAHSLSLIAKHGSQAFYQGSIAKQIVQASKQHGGVLSLKDFKNYQVKWRTPIRCVYRHYQIISAPLPSSGGITLCEILHILQAYPLSHWGAFSARTIHVNAEAMRYAYADRNHYLGDSDFIKVPVTMLLSQKRANFWRQKIKFLHAGNSAEIKFPIATQHERPQTTAFMVADSLGNIVNITYTLNGWFGSGLIAGNTGFFLNNEMDDFSLQLHGENLFRLKQGKANLVAPLKRPLSSMTPTFVFTPQNKPYLSLGAAGGSTIITQVLAMIEQVIDFHLPLNTALLNPRYHMQGLPDVLFSEHQAFSKSVYAKLKHMGYQVKQHGLFKRPHWGVSAGIQFTQQHHQLLGAVEKLRHPTALALGWNH